MVRTRRWPERREGDRERGEERTIKVERKTLRIFNFFYLAFVLRPFVMFAIACKLFVLLLVSLRCVYAKKNISCQLPTTNYQLPTGSFQLASC